MEIGFHTFPSGKQYVYVKTPGAAKAPRVFLRNILFLRRASKPSEIALVHEWGASSDVEWEPPKGQMEWKEFAARAGAVASGSIIQANTLANYMREGVLREMSEEAKVKPEEIQNLRMLPLAYEQAWAKASTTSHPARFRYQFWEAQITDSIMLEAQARLKALVTHPNLHSMPSDVKEKDAIVWWDAANPDWKMIRESFSKKMTSMFVDYVKKHGVSNS
jgi:ADP-ribose pyrophosphatase YjhB (NUDIX family)